MSLAATGAQSLAPAGEIIVRTSTEDDVAAMLAIYKHHVQRGLGAFDLEPSLRRHLAVAQRAIESPSRARSS